MKALAKTTKGPVHLQLFRPSVIRGPWIDVWEPTSLSSSHQTRLYWICKIIIQLHCTVLQDHSKQDRSFQNWETHQQMSITNFSELSGIKRWEWSRFLFSYYSMEDQRYSALLSSKKLIYVPISHSLYYLNFDFLFWIETVFCPKYF